MSFGPMPIANAFRRADEAATPEYTFELAPAFCDSCGTFQLVDQPDPALMFHGDYAFFSGTSRAMADHFGRFAADVRRDHLGPDPFVVEIGCNDGILLRHFGTGRHLGVEPSRNVAAAARDQGLAVREDFFGTAVAEAIRADHGPADAVLAANVLCHIPDVHDLAEGISRLLGDDGVLVFEEPHLGAMIEKTAYDQLYDEHVFMFSLQSVGRIFADHGLELFHAAPQPTHGGGMRYFLGRPGRRPATAALAAERAREAELGLDRPATYDAFRRRVERSRDALMAVLADHRAAGRRVVGYAATSKSTTVINYCGITPDHLAFITDSTPLKQGRVSPGAHIPIRPPEAFRDPWPDAAVLFAWNHRDEIMAKEADYPGDWITFVPEVRVESRR